LRTSRSIPFAFSTKQPTLLRRKNNPSLASLAEHLFLQAAALSMPPFDLALQATF